MATELREPFTLLAEAYSLWQGFTYAPPPFPPPGAVGLSSTVRHRNGEYSRISSRRHRACRRLDSLPLALELVAPKVRSLSARDIVALRDQIGQTEAAALAGTTRRLNPRVVMQHYCHVASDAGQLSLFGRRGSSQRWRRVCG